MNTTKLLQDDSLNTVVGGTGLLFFTLFIGLLFGGGSCRPAPICPPRCWSPCRPCSPCGGRGWGG